MSILFMFFCFVFVLFVCFFKPNSLYHLCICRTSEPDPVSKSPTDKVHWFGPQQTTKSPTKPNIHHKPSGRQTKPGRNWNHLVGRQRPGTQKPPACENKAVANWITLLNSRSQSGEEIFVQLTLSNIARMTSPPCHLPFYGETISAING